MKTSSNRVKGALISAAALAAFGMIIPANAAGKPDPGTVGHVNHPQATPPGQQPDPSTGDDGNNGWQCDGNNGAGVGNPAQPNDCGGSYTSGGGNGNGGNGGNGGGGGGGGNGGGKGATDPAPVGG